MKRVEQQITRIRRETENDEFGDTFGVSDEEFLGYLNDAQERIYAEINKKHPKFFLNEKIDNVPVNTEQYSLPPRIFLGMISLVEYSSTGSEEDYYRLPQAAIPERLSFAIGNPKYYIRRNKDIWFVPAPGNFAGFIRITYVERLPTLDIRRGTISAVSTSGSEITSLTLDTTQTLDRDKLLEEQFLCVVDKYGDLKMAGIPISDISSTTGVVTLDPGFTFESGETIGVGDFVVAGEYATNKSELLDTCERYLVSHLRMEVLDRDSNAPGTGSQSEKMQRLLMEIVESFADNSDDVFEPTILDPQYLIDDNFY